jgi:hypothetical protein
MSQPSVFDVSTSHDLPPHMARELRDELLEAAREIERQIVELVISKIEREEECEHYSC